MQSGADPAGVGAGAAVDHLRRVHVRVDELHRLRFLDEETSGLSVRLRDECADFVTKLREFQGHVRAFLCTVHALMADTEREKMKALALRSRVRAAEGAYDSLQQLYVALIIEKRAELDRLRVLHKSLVREQQEGSERIEQFLLKS